MYEQKADAKTKTNAQIDVIHVVIIKWTCIFIIRKIAATFRLVIGFNIFKYETSSHERRTLFRNSKVISLKVAELLLVIKGVSLCFFVEPK